MQYCTLTRERIVWEGKRGGAGLSQKRCGPQPRSGPTTQKRPAPHCNRLILWTGRHGFTPGGQGFTPGGTYEVCIAYSKRRIRGPVLGRGPGQCRWGAW